MYKSYAVADVCWQSAQCGINSAHGTAFQRQLQGWEISTSDYRYQIGSGKPWKTGLTQESQKKKT